MTYYLGVVLVDCCLSLDEWGLGIFIASFHCLLLGFMWPTSSKGTLAWTREMKRLFVWWKHGFICITKRDQEWSKHGRKIEGMRDQLCTLRKRRNKKRNLNISYSIVGSGSSKMPKKKSFDLYFLSMVWCKLESTNY